MKIKLKLKDFALQRDDKWLKELQLPENLLNQFLENYAPWDICSRFAITCTPLVKLDSTCNAKYYFLFTYFVFDIV